MTTDVYDVVRYVTQPQTYLVITTNTDDTTTTC